MQSGGEGELELEESESGSESEWVVVEPELGRDWRRILRNKWRNASLGSSRSLDKWSDQLERRFFFSLPRSRMGLGSENMFSSGENDMVVN